MKKGAFWLAETGRVDAGMLDSRCWIKFSYQADRQYPYVEVVNYSGSVHEQCTYEMCNKRCAGNSRMQQRALANPACSNSMCALQQKKNGQRKKRQWIAGKRRPICSSVEKGGHAQTARPGGPGAAANPARERFPSVVPCERAARAWRNCRTARSETGPSPQTAPDSARERENSARTARDSTSPPPIALGAKPIRARIRFSVRAPNLPRRCHALLRGLPNGPATGLLRLLPRRLAPRTPLQGGGSEEGGRKSKGSF